MKDTPGCDLFQGARVVDNAMHSWHSLFSCPTRLTRHAWQPDRVCFVERIGISNTGSIALFTALGFGVFQTASGFDEVKMWIVSVGWHGLARRVRTRLSLILDTRWYLGLGQPNTPNPSIDVNPPFPLFPLGTRGKSLRL